MNVWQFILDKLSGTQNVMLLYVLESEGSSPGRKGFKMAVAAGGTFCGTIGGGIMEHKLVEKAKSILQQSEKTVLLMRQHHDKEHANNQSGMICSGSQLNAFIPLTISDKLTIEKIISARKGSIQLSPKGLQFVDETATNLQYNTDADWLYSEAINQQPVIHIIGGGHVGLALSELMNFLGFYIKLYDDRPELNTIAANSFAHEKHIVNYDLTADHFTNIENDYAVIMTIGYRTDKTVLKQLLDKPFLYLGLLGSDHKIKTLFKELSEEGVSKELLAKIFSPIGLNISSKTAKEIAVSIAAEIIQKKNREG
jgi:xanthine dehydrogenase accessory factor